MKRTLRHLPAVIGLIASTSAWAADGRLVYQNLKGLNTASTLVSETCGTTTNGVPVICGTDSTDARISYWGLDGFKRQTQIVTPICGVDSNGVPQICDFATSSDLSAYVTSAAAQTTYAQLAATNSFTTEQQFAYAYFADPDQGVSRDAKFGDRGIAVKGGTKTDTLTVTTSASVPDTTKTDYSTAPLNTESANARFVTLQTLTDSYETLAGMSSYVLKTNGTLITPTITKPSIDGGALTTDGEGNWVLSGNNGIQFGGKEWLNYNAADGYIGVNGDLEITGRVNLPTRATGDNGNYAASTAFVQNTINAMQGSVTGDLSASGSSLTLPVGSSGLDLVMSYSASGTGALTAVAASGTLTPVDIYEVASWGTTSFKGYTLDSGTITTTATSVDSTFYLTSNAVGTYHIGVGGHLYIVDIFGSGAGKRTFMSWRMVE